MKSPNPIYAVSGAHANGKTNLKAWAAMYADTIQTHIGRGPISLGGWSLGGIMALEVAQRLVADGISIEEIILLDSVPPNPLEAAKARKNPKFLENIFAADLVGRAAGQSHRERILGSESIFQRGSLEDILARERHALDEVEWPHEEEVRPLFQKFMKHFEAFHQYVPEGIDWPLHVILSEDTEKNSSRNPAEFWRELSYRGFFLETIAGDHYSILRGSNVLQTASVLERILSSNMNFQASSSGNSSFV